MRPHTALSTTFLLVAGLAWAAPPATVRLEPAAHRVGRYEKIGFRLSVNRTYANPYDPAEVGIDLELRAPSGGSLSVPAFWYQPYEERVIKRDGHDAAWLYPSAPAGWRARFAPAEVGEYTAVARLRDRDGTAVSNRVSFACVPSASHGYLRVSKRNPRYFSLTDGTPFFAIGEDIAFIGPTQYVNLPRVSSTFRRMSSNGANFARVWACCGDWGMAIEAPKSAWERSWSSKGPIVDVPGQPGAGAQTPALKAVELKGAAGATLPVSPSEPVALRPNTRYVIAGSMRAEGGAGLAVRVNGAQVGDAVTADPKQPWTDFRREFTTGPQTWWLGPMNLRLTGAGRVLLRDLSLCEAGGGPDLLWEADPNRPARGVYNPTDCFMLDQVLEAAEKTGLRLQLCMLTRDLYMGDLKTPGSPDYERAVSYAKRLFRYAVGRWGYSTSVASWEYWNEQNPGLPTGPFYTALGQYLARVDVYHHLRTTSAWAPAPKDWRNPDLDVADEHWYLRPNWVDPQVGPAPWKDVVASVLNRARLVLSEAPGKPAMLAEFGLANEKWGLSPYMKQDRDLVHFHNALWSSALSGLAGTTMFWWWEQLDQQDAYRQYRPLAAFVKGVPFTSARLAPAAVKTTSPEVRAVGLSGKDRAYLWLCSARATWWARAIEKKTPAPVEGAEVEIDGLAPGTYAVQWWDTTSGKITRTGSARSEGGTMHLAVPTFATDLACKITPASG